MYRYSSIQRKNKKQIIIEFLSFLSMMKMRQC